MRGNKRQLIRTLTIALLASMWSTWALPTLGQEAEPLPQIYITGNDITSPPSAALHVYGRDVQGNAIDFSSESIILSHDGETLQTSVTDSVPIGTFTVFLVDLPPGIDDQLPAIQQAIQQFAAPGGGMQEQVDSIAIYQVGETEARQLLAPTTFYNEVQNFFVDDMAPETDSTALQDGLAILLEEVQALKPRPEMVASVVVMSDGTDVVSTQFEPQDIVARSIEQDVPVHTIWVNSAGLTIDQQQQGQAFLQETATATRGFSAFLDDTAAISDLWDRIAAFRDHARVRYELDGATGGAYEVTLSLASDPAVSDSTVVEVPENQPQVFLNLPPGSDEITMQSVAEPVLLRLGATVSWLDGLEREVRQATLRVNGLDVADIPPEQLQDFTVEVGNLQFGDNELELFVEDEQGLQASNLPTTITVLEGDQQVIPEELQPGREMGNIVLNTFLVLVVLGVLAGLVFWLMRSGIFSRLMPRGRSQPAGQGVSYTAGVDPQAVGDLAGSDLKAGPPFEAHLEIVESVTDMPQSLELLGAMIRVGRSPSMSDVAFRDDLTVSRQHAVLMLEGNHFRLFDENSTSGTWVNGRQVPDYGVELADGDEIHIGAVHMIYHQPY